MMRRAAGKEACYGMLWSHGSKLRKVETLSGRLKCTNAWRRLLVKMQRWGDEMPWGSLAAQASSS